MNEIYPCYVAVTGIDRYSHNVYIFISSGNTMLDDFPISAVVFLLCITNRFVNAHHKQCQDDVVKVCGRSSAEEQPCDAMHRQCNLM